MFESHKKPGNKAINIDKNMVKNDLTRKHPRP